jgi:bifunctional non-homologous end joining protein LigD
VAQHIGALFIRRVLTPFGNDCRRAGQARVRRKGIGFEGILAKRADSFYESGKRSGAWLNYRINKGQEFVIGGYVPNNPIDSSIVGYYDDGKLLYVGKVRNGFVPR